MRIGVLGGTFDPPHAGHLAMARAGIAALDLEEVLLVPASRNPLKQQLKMSSARHRLAMVEAMIESEPKLAACDVEVMRGGISYAVETLTELTVSRPGDYWFLVGADAALQIEQWKQPQRLLKLCRLGIVLRHPIDQATLLRRMPSEFKDRFDIVPMDPSNVSSTGIRDQLFSGRNPGSDLPPAVYAYIRRNNLYKA